MTTGVKTVIGIVIATVVIAVGYYGYKEKQVNPIETTTGNSTTTTTTGTTGNTGGKPSGKKMAFADFAKQNGTYKCSVTAQTQGGSVTGTVYMDQGKIRGETSIPGATPMTATFIIRDGFVYYWNSAMMKGQGIKLAYDINNYKSGDFSQFDEIGDYTCENWTADQSKFALPSGVTFQTMQ